MPISSASRTTFALWTSRRTGHRPGIRQAALSGLTVAPDAGASSRDIDSELLGRGDGGLTSPLRDGGSSPGERAGAGAGAFPCSNAVAASQEAFAAARSSRPPSVAAPDLPPDDTGGLDG